MASKKKTGSTGKRPPQKGGKSGPAKGGGKGKAAGGGQRKGRITPVEVKNPKPWGLITTFSVVGLAAVGLIVAAVFVVMDNDPDRPIDGEIDYRDQGAEFVDISDHVTGPVDYEAEYGVIPPAGGKHNGTWQNCNGIVYDDQIPNEHAVHSMEHGAVWITYNPDLVDQAGIDTLTGKVEGQDYTMMSQYPDQQAPISLQAWGYQLTVDRADDARIDQFIDKYRVSASIEPGATCSSELMVTGPTPIDAGDGMTGEGVPTDDGAASDGAASDEPTAEDTAADDGTES